MIDLHCHILPALDDGPAGMEEAVQMGRIAAADGIRSLVATPHVNGDLLPPESIREAVQTLNGALQEAGISLEVLPGADTSALLPADVLRHYTINNTHYVFLEFPHSYLPQNAGEMIFAAVLGGLTPIITHPERNPGILRQPDRLFSLIEGGALVQITAESLTGGFGQEARDCAFYLLRKEAVHFIATDAHSTRRRPPVLSRGMKAAARVLGDAKARRLVVENPAAVLAGTPLYA